jgi:cell wall-associated NlpC family hydrolase
MSTTTTGSVAPQAVSNIALRPGQAMTRRLVCMMTALLLGLTLALNPVSAPRSDAAVSAGVGAAALRVARAQIGIPYRYGGMSRAGFDCSGLTKYSYARVGRWIPRTAQQQYNASIHIRWNQRRFGDLVFFYSGSTIYHVGIYAGNWRMVVAPHAGTRVQVQRIWSTHVLFGRVR